MVWGRKSKKSQAEFHVYNRNGQKLKTVKALCAHKDRLNIQTVVVESTEYLAVACCRCTDINLYHLGKETAYPAFSSDYPGPMCHGREGTLFAVNSCKNDDKEFDLTEIVCKRMQFTYGQVFQTHLKKVPDVCYIPTRDILVLSTHKNPKYRDDLASDEDVSDDEEKKKEDEGPLVIRAVSCKNKKILWEVKEVDGVPCVAHGMLYLLKYDVLLVGDGSTGRLLVLRPESGECLQSFYIGSHAGAVWDPYRYRDQLIVTHTIGNKIRFSYYSVSIYLSYDSSI